MGNPTCKGFFEFADVGDGRRLFRNEPFMLHGFRHGKNIHPLDEAGSSGTNHNRFGRRSLLGARSISRAPLNSADSVGLENINVSEPEMGETLPMIK